MNKVYSRINWENEPSTKTPLNEHNLNKIDFAVDEIDNRVIELDSTKAKNTDLQTLSTRVDNLILNAGDSSVEAADARVTEDGTVYDTLKNRLDAEHSNVTSDISKLSNDLVNLPISNINTELLNKIIDVKITPNRYIVGYDTTTFKPILAHSNNLSVIDFKIDTTNPLIKIDYDWENSLGNAYILYSDNKAINCTVGNFKNETEVVSSDNNSVTIDVRRGYFTNYERCSIVVPINHTNVKSVDNIDCQMKRYIEGVADVKFINKNFINGMYGNAGDGSAIVYIDKILSETERDVLLKLNGDYEFLSVILWTSGFGYLGGYDYKRNATTDGIVIHLPINTEMIQITTSTPISNNNKINVVIDELLIDKRLNVIETNISDRISSGSYGDAGDGSRLVSLGVTMAKGTEIILKCQEGYSYKMAAAVDTSKTIWEYGKFSLFENNYVKVVVPKGYSMIQFWLSEPTADNIKVKTYYEYSIKEKLEYVENKVDCNKPIMASVNMFNSIGAIGDSYTEGSCSDSQGVWHNVTNQSWVGTMAKRSGVDFNNYGQGGATTRSYIVNKLQSVLENNPDDIYFMALGQNDGNQAIPIGTIADIHDEDYTLNADTFYGCYGKIIQQVKNHAPKAKIVMIKGWIQGITWQNYDIAIEEIANHYNIPCISPFDDSFFSSNTYVDYMDGSHPTAMGYSMMGISMERLFSKCVEENPSYFKYSTIG